MPSLDFQAVREALNITQVLELVGFAVAEQSSDQVRGLCLVSGSTSPPSLAAVAATELSPRRKPWVIGQDDRKAPAGAKEWRDRRAPEVHREPRRWARSGRDGSVAPTGAFSAFLLSYPRLAPWAMFFRRCRGWEVRLQRG